MKQQCFLVMIYVSWTIYLGGAAYLLYTGHYLNAALWLLIVPFAQLAYMRVFPKLSKMMGYGSVEDTAATVVSAAQVNVTLYTALGCPFCPIVEQRLEALQREMKFTLTKLDVTLKPQLITSKNIRAIPVVEVGYERLVGNATSEELAQLIADAAGNSKTVPATAGT